VHEHSKVCKGCGKTKPASMFSKQKGVRDGLRSRCKECLNNQGKEYGAEYREKHRERRNAEAREYRRKNADTLKAKRLQRYRENPTKYKKAARDCRLRKPETKKQWAKKNADRLKAYWHKRRANKINAGGSYTAKEITALLSRQRSKCPICKTGISSKYHIDHIMPLTLGGSNYISNIQLLCPQCNLSKGARHPIEFMQSLGYLL
jgi:5-methylcytosine-specific restriction endonuclease McrA